jgi:hypothetical protein
MTELLPSITLPVDPHSIERLDDELVFYAPEGATVYVVTQDKLNIVAISPTDTSAEFVIARKE